GTLERLKLYYASNQRSVAVSFFAAGFVVDMLTLGRIDSWLTIGQQIVYLGLILIVLLQLFFEEARQQPPGRYFKHRAALVHFLLGTLLNLYALFFFKSSSLLVSFAFLGFLVLLLVANESARFKSMGLAFKFVLLSLCLLSFFAAMVPVFVGSIGLWVFLLSMLVGCLPLAAVAAWIRRKAPELFPRARRQILLPLGGVLVGFLAFYLFRLIPPVPLSIPFIGVYHGVERTEQGYLLSHERPAWRFWHNGDQQFVAQPGDKVYVYFRVFSPANFSDQVLLRWYRKGERWSLQDTIPIRIVGGREAGFRGYGVKTNYQSGEWKVQVETTDGREIGRVYFDLETVPEAPRSLGTDLDA
ncbi:MAG: DUF2914 domain-containing protein, partial [Burkholderiales bacterium]